MDLPALGGGVLTTIARVSPTTCHGSGGNYKFGGGREALSLLSLLLGAARFIISKQQLLLEFLRNDDRGPFVQVYAVRPP